MTGLTVFDHIKVLVESYRLGLLHETLHVMLVERQGVLLVFAISWEE